MTLRSRVDRLEEDAGDGVGCPACPPHVIVRAGSPIPVCPACGREAPNVTVLVVRIVDRATVGKGAPCES
jgi:ribosomal protein L37AE/L43A